MNLNPTPAPITVITGDQHKVRKTIDDFFLETSLFIKKTCSVSPGDVKVESGELSYSAPNVTDDRVSYLSYKDFIVACVFEKRTEFNNIQYTFFRNIDNLKEAIRRD